MSLFRSAGDSGALQEVTGTISNNTTWDEYIYFIEDGAAVDLTGLSFEFQFRESPESGAATVKVLSTADSELVITADSGGTNSILRINVPYTTINALDGDYIADLVAKDAADKLIHYASGVVTFRPSPVAV